MLDISYSLHGHNIIYCTIFDIMIGSPFDVKGIIRR